MGQDRLLEHSQPPRAGASKRRPLRGDGDDVADARLSHEARRRRRIAAVALLLLVVVGTGSAVWWFAWGQKWRQEVAVEAGFKELSARHARRFAAYKNWTDEDQLRALAGDALDPEVFKPPQTALAEAALRLAMRRGSRDAALDLGLLYRDGKLGAADTGKALKLFDGVREEVEPAARAGEASALIVLGRIYGEGLGVHADQSKAIEMTLRGARSGTPEQKRRVGRSYASGDGIFANRGSAEEGLGLVEEAARAGHVHAMESAGDMLFLDALRKQREQPELDVTSMRRRAYEWYAKAAQLGRTSAMPDAAREAWEIGDLAGAEKWLEAAHRSGIDDDPMLLGLFRVMRSSGTISGNTPGVEMLAKSLIRQPFRDGPVDADTSFFNALSAYFAAVRGVEAAPAGSLPRQRAAIVSLAWIDVLIRLRARPEFPDREPLDKYLRGLPRQTRSEVMADSQRLADIIYPSSRQPQKQQATRPEAPTAQARAASTPQPNKQARAVPSEPPPQDTSGYLNGEPRAPGQGLSTFAIDNTRGSAGAIVRLYRDGRMPAAYSFFVKQGESFTGTGLVAGNYVLRYRNLGSGKVYEADKRFDFEETRVEGGTKYSRAQITLFPVPGGNMKTVPVDDSKF